MPQENLGAESLGAQTVRTGVLCLHGFGGTPEFLRYTAKALSKAGFAVSSPLLPGHGTTPGDLERCDRRARIDSARTAPTESRAHCCSAHSIATALAADRKYVVTACRSGHGPPGRLRPRLPAPIAIGFIRDGSPLGPYNRTYKKYSYIYDEAGEAGSGVRSCARMGWAGPVRDLAESRRAAGDCQWSSATGKDLSAGCSGRGGRGVFLHRRGRDRGRGAGGFRGGRHGIRRWRSLRLPELE